MSLLPKTFNSFRSGCNVSGYVLKIQSCSIELSHPASVTIHASFGESRYLETCYDYSNAKTK